MTKIIILLIALALFAGILVGFFTLKHLIVKKLDSMISASTNRVEINILSNLRQQIYWNEI